jgi:hypothetical protein
MQIIEYVVIITNSNAIGGLGKSEWYILSVNSLFVCWNCSSGLTSLMLNLKSSSIRILARSWSNSPRLTIHRTTFAIRWSLKPSYDAMKMKDVTTLSPHQGAIITRHFASRTTSIVFWMANATRVFAFSKYIPRPLCSHIPWFDVNFHF